MSARAPGWFQRNGICPSLWARARRAVLDRDGWRCVECGRAGRLQVHHRTRPADGGERYAPDNLKSVCRACHVGEHRRMAREGMAPARLAWAEFVDSFGKDAA